MVNGSKEGSSLGDIVNTLENKGFGLLLVVLSLPSALPVPAAGYSTPFGIVIFILGLQLLTGRDAPWIPRRMREVRLSRKLSERVIGGGSQIFVKIEHLIRPRLHWIHRGVGQRGLALLVMAMAFLMCLPIPTTNTFPAMVIFLVGVSLAEEDGLFGFGACLVGVLAIAIYVVPLYLLVTFVAEYGLVGGFEEITSRMNDWKEAFKEWFNALF